MARYSYELSTTSTLTNVETILADATNGYREGVAPKGRFYEASILLDRLDGSRAGHGTIRAVWLFDILTQTMVNALRVICPGYSANVYLRTRKTNGSFAYFTGIMLWPTQQQMDKRNFNGRYLGLEFEFRNLEEYTP